MEFMFSLAIWEFFFEKFVVNMETESEDLMMVEQKCRT